LGSDFRFHPTIDEKGEGREHVKLIKKRRAFLIFQREVHEG